MTKSENLEKHLQITNSYDTISNIKSCEGVEYKMIKYKGLLKVSTTAFLIALGFEAMLFMMFIVLNIGDSPTTEYVKLYPLLSTIIGNICGLLALITLGLFSHSLFFQTKRKSMNQKSILYKGEK